MVKTVYVYFRSDCVFCCDVGLSAPVLATITRVELIPQCLNKPANAVDSVVNTKTHSIRRIDSDWSPGNSEESDTTTLYSETNHKIMVRYSYVLSQFIKTIKLALIRVMQ